MPPYSILMFAFAILILIVALLVYRGNYGLIRTYYAAKMKDKKAYFRAVGKAIALTAVAPVLSGVVALFGDLSETIWPFLVLIVSVAILLFFIAKRFKKGDL